MGQDFDIRTRLQFWQPIQSGQPRDILSVPVHDTVKLVEIPPESVV